MHVVDGSNPDASKDIAAVRTVLAEIGAAELPEMVIFNKADLAAGGAIF